ncbi:MAG: NADH-quinone oxidoreductase subunit L [Candidatus Zixiibacteriota bacterium]|nr:MAG: NADH-quinone oxidoreductase subunit L [candidate division Zixibacteria bacterium]
MIPLAIIVLLAPLAAFTVVIFLGKRLPRGGDWVSLTAIFGGLAISLGLLLRMIFSGDPNFGAAWQFDWLTYGDTVFRIGINLDAMAIIMLVVVTLVSALVHLFSVSYMKGDVRYSRFFSYLSFFSFSMLGLVLADNLFIIFCFWELVGLSSYLLIGFWYEKKSASDAAVKAFVTNRIGDFGMVIGLALVLGAVGTLNLKEVIGAVEVGRLSGGMLTAAGLLLFCGAIGKSAQFPLHVWLPDAMEGPTPVSALIHAATMVAAGVYLTARIFPILTPEAGQVIAYVGGFTAFMAATIAVAQNDIKRVLAYSTVSQLGYMIMALGAGAYTAGFFHLVTHAMFKAALFLGSGSVIHAMHHSLHKVHSHADPQDMRNMGGLRKHLPTTYKTFLLATIALAGVPLTSGFLSKDAILGGTLAYARLHPGNWPLVFFGFGAAALTAFYMFRLIFLTFFGEFRGGKQAESHLHESPRNMTIPLVVLSGLTFFLFYTLPAFNPTSPEGGWFARAIQEPVKAYEAVHIPAHETSAPELGMVEEHGLTPAPGTIAHETEAHGSSAAVHDAHAEHEAHVEHSSHLIAMALSIFVAGLGIWIAWLTYFKWVINPATWQQRLGVIYRGMFNKWWFDEIYHATVIKGSHVLGAMMVWFDLKVIDGIVDGSAWCMRQWAFISGWFDNTFVDGAVNGTAGMVSIWGRLARLFQTGQVQRYMLVSVLVLAILLLLKM